jgi:hypothetical protein
MTNYFPAGLVIWLLVYLLKKDKPTDPIDVPNAPRYIPESESECKPEKHIQYISNGRVLNDTLFFYYYDMLRLTDKKDLNEHTILKYADMRYSLINKIDYDVNWPIAKRDVYAGKAYLLDRWYYMTNLN